MDYTTEKLAMLNKQKWGIKESLMVSASASALTTEEKQALFDGLEELLSDAFHDHINPLQDELDVAGMAEATRQEFRDRANYHGSV